MQASCSARPIRPTQIINETLSRSFDLHGQTPDQQALAQAIEAGIDLTGGESELKAHPVAIWLENAIALEDREGQLVRGKPRRLSDIANALADASGKSYRAMPSVPARPASLDQHRQSAIAEQGRRYTLLPFKLHQFISQTGSVYTTLDQDENRFITLEPGVYRVEDGAKKPIYPNVFSRASGHAFICVSRQGNKLEPREFRASSN